MPPLRERHGDRFTRLEVLKVSCRLLPRDGEPLIPDLG
jgi:hypothetical protein